jgi:outer membrane protein assembly factor BamB
VNTEERQLSDLLRRLTPEPPRKVTVEDVAFRLANQAGRGQGRYREPRPRRGRRRIGGRGLVPALAALSVFVVAGLSAGAAVLLSHHGTPPVASGGVPTSMSASASSSSTPPTPVQVSTAPVTQPLAIADGPFGAELIDHHTFTQDSLVSGDGSLYATTPGYLDRIDPATGAVAEVSVGSLVPGPPVVVGHTVWVVSYQPGGVIDLLGYDASTLARIASWPVTALGAVSSTAQGALAAGPDGTLFVAAGVTVLAVDSSTGQPVRRYFLPAGSASSSVAVSPNGSTLYAGYGSFRLVTFSVAGGQVTGNSAMNIGGAGGNLVATPSGVWGTVGVGMSEWVWFAPAGDLSRAARVSQGAGAGFASVPSYSGGSVWIGGGQTLACADPSTGQVLTSARLPTDHGALEYFSSVAVVDGQAYAYYEDQAARLTGIVKMTLPSAC